MCFKQNLNKTEKTQNPKACAINEAHSCIFFFFFLPGMSITAAVFGFRQRTVSDCCASKDYRDHPVTTYPSAYLKRALPKPFNPTFAFISDLFASQEHILRRSPSVSQRCRAQLTEEETEARCPGASCPHAKHLVCSTAKPGLPAPGSCSILAAFPPRL